MLIWASTMICERTFINATSRSIGKGVWRLVDVFPESKCSRSSAMSWVRNNDRQRPWFLSFSIHLLDSAHFPIPNLSAWITSQSALHPISFERSWHRYARGNYRKPDLERICSNGERLHVRFFSKHDHPQTSQSTWSEGRRRLLMVADELRRRAESIHSIGIFWVNELRSEKLKRSLRSRRSCWKGIKNPMTDVSSDFLVSRCLTQILKWTALLYSGL